MLLAFAQFRQIQDIDDFVEAIQFLEKEKIDRKGSIWRVAIAQRMQNSLKESAG